MPIKDRAKPTALYRLFGKDDRLLYVGIAVNPDKRIANHRNNKPWWPEVTRHTIDWLGDWESALKREAEAIHAERPVHNIIHRPYGTAEQTGRSGFDLVLPVWESRTRLRDILDAAQFNGRRTLIERHGTPVAAIVPMRDAERLFALDDGA